MSTHLVLIHALSPMHCGTGQAISGIDLPIARERPTGTPIVPGSSLKGVLRSQPGGFEVDDGGGAKKPRARDLHIATFGPETENASEHAGAVQFADAHVVFLPVRSVRGTFAWVTSPHLLRRLDRDAKECSLGWRTPKGLSLGAKAAVAKSRLLVDVNNAKRVVFEDFDFEANVSNDVAVLAQSVAEALYGRDATDDVTHFVERACVVDDDVMRVLLRVGMEVVARNRIDDDTKTVAKGALWTEEALPAETILSGSLLASPVRRGDDAARLVEHVRSLCKKPIQLGGKATVGRGLCKVKVL